MFVVPITRMPEVESLEQLAQKDSAERLDNKDVSFANIFEQAIREADQAQEATDMQDELLASGSIDNLHTAMIQAEQTAAAVEFTTQLASKAVSAYNQIMGMQV